jgi:hypothetical protein
LFICLFVSSWLALFDLKGRDILSVAAAAASAAATAASPLSPNDLGLRPHEIRDLIRRGLWPKPHGPDEDRGTSACVSAALFQRFWLPGTDFRDCRPSGVCVGRICVKFRNFFSHFVHFWTEIHQKFAPIRRDSTGVLWRIKKLTACWSQLLDRLQLAE